MALKTFEMDENDLLAQQAVMQNINRMMLNPKAREKLLAAKKEIDPDMVIPEIDAVQKLRGEMSEQNSQIAEAMKEIKGYIQKQDEEKKIAEFTNKWEKQKQSLRQSGFRDDGIAAVESFAQENGIGDLKIAAAAWEKMNPPPEPVQSSNGAWNMFDLPKEENNYIEKIFKAEGNDDRLVDSEIASVLKEMRGQPGMRI